MEKKFHESDLFFSKKSKKNEINDFVLNSAISGFYENAQLWGNMAMLYIIGKVSRRLEHQWKNYDNRIHSSREKMG